MSSYESLAPFYDTLTRDVDYDGFIRFYESVFAKYGVKPELVLDLACGTGTLTCRMAERGYEMIGTDISEEMLAAASDKAETLHNCVKPIFLCQAMNELDLYGTVSAAICSLDGINYVPESELDEIFRRLKLFVEPGGIFIFDIISPDHLKNQDGEMFIDETDDVYCVWRSEFDTDENACFYGMDIFTRGEDDLWERTFEEHTEYAHSIEMLTEKLEKNGFGEINVFAEFELAPPCENDRRLFITSRRL